MANFRIMPGMFVKIIKDFHPAPGTGPALMIGEEVQILGVSRQGTLAFTNIPGVFDIVGVGQYIEPIRWTLGGERI